MTVGWADLAAVLVLGLFALWGGMRGLVRQVLSLALLAGALWAAGRHGPDAERLVAKVASLDGEARCLVSYAAVALAVFGVASLVLGAAARLLGRVRLPGFSVPGAVLGLAKGAVVWVLAVHAILLAWRGETTPAFVQEVLRSRSAPWAVAAARHLRDVLPTPGCVARAVEDVGRRLPR